MSDSNQDVSNDDILAMLAGTLMPSEIKERRAQRKAIRERNQLKGAKQLEYEEYYRRHTTLHLMRQIKLYTKGAFRCTSTWAIDREARYHALRKLIAQRPKIESEERPHGVVARRIAAQSNHGCGKSKNR